MDVIAVEGHNVQRTTVSAITMYIGSRYDVILCFDQVSFFLHFTMMSEDGKTWRIFRCTLQQDNVLVIILDQFLLVASRYCKLFDKTKFSLEGSTDWQSVRQKSFFYYNRLAVFQ